MAIEQIASWLIIILIAGIGLRAIIGSVIALDRKIKDVTYSEHAGEPLLTLTTTIYLIFMTICILYREFG
jgi:hypothetical protein